jgi:hypothetical protein
VTVDPELLALVMTDAKVIVGAGFFRAAQSKE